MLGEIEEQPPGAWRQPVLALGLILWLGALWFLSDATVHRWGLFGLVLPGVIANAPTLKLLVRREPWVWLVIALLGYQWLSRFWSGVEGEIVSEGYWLDVIMTMILLGGMLAVADSSLVRKWMLPALGTIAALVSLYSLLVFYSEADRSVADDRFRNVLIYENGLNPVLTGLMSSFAALVVIGQTTAGGRWRWAWLAALVVIVLAMLASQSRGALLAFGCGLLVFLVFERKKVLPALGVTVGTTLAFFAILFWVQSGSEAAKDLIGRGATGRFEVYGWFFQKMNGLEGLIGKGMEHPSSISEDVFGWFVGHPHSIYVTQFYLTGVIGTGLMLLILAMALRTAWTLAVQGEALWLVLLGGFGLALVFDGSHVFSVFSTGRIEPLLLLFPAAMAVGRAHRVSAGSRLPDED